jgi:hypothetical protein
LDRGRIGGPAGLGRRLRDGAGEGNIMMARMKALEDFGRKFSNRREWREVLSAVQCSVKYPAVLNALRASACLFNDTVVARVTTPAVLTERIK